MDNLTDKLLELKELLEKSMNNSGTGGAGSVKAGSVLPNINKLPKPGHASTAGKVKIPGQASASKKNPLDVAQQTHNKDIKDIRMKEAHAQMVMQKSDEISFADNGQWSLSKGAQNSEPTKTMQHEPSPEHEKVETKVHPEFSGVEHLEYMRHKSGKNSNLERKKGKELQDANIDIARRHIKAAKVSKENGNKDATKAYLDAAKEALTVKKSLQERLNDIIETLDKSNYPGEYDEADNAKRKAKNTGETTGIRTMDSVKAYGGSGPSAAAREAKEMKAKSKKMPVKVYTSEEIAALNNPTKKTEGRTTAAPGVSEMGIETRRSNPKSQSYARVVSPEKHGETAKDIARANIKQTQSIKPNLPK